jgi:ADP-heptose:LPS heptosyltransferase
MKTIVVYHKQLGDTLLLQPALAKLASQDGEPVGLITRPEFADLVRLMPGTSPVTWLKAPLANRLLCYDAGTRSALVSLWCRSKIKHLLTFSDFYVRQYHHFIFNRITLKDQEQMYRGLYFWTSTPGPVEGDFKTPQLNNPPDDWMPQGLPSEPFVLIHPTSAWKRKCLSVGSWHNVIDLIIQKTQLPIVLTGGLSDWEKGLCAEISASNAYVINLGGLTDLRGLLATISRASFAFTVDGFASHLATAFQKPCMTIFGPTNVNHWHARIPLNCSLQPTQKNGITKNFEITDIGSKELLNQSENFLDMVSFKREK